MEDPPLEDHEEDQMQAEMIKEIYQNVTDDSGQPQQKSETPQAVSASAIDHIAATSVQPSNHMPVDSEQKEFKKIHITEEARKEANRLKALERVKMPFMEYLYVSHGNVEACI